MLRVSYTSKGMSTQFVTAYGSDPARSASGLKGKPQPFGQGIAEMEDTAAGHYTATVGRYPQGCTRWPAAPPAFPRRRIAGRNTCLARPAAVRAARDAV